MQKKLGEGLRTWGGGDYFNGVEEIILNARERKCVFVCVDL